jgi:glycosyltransferase involved in cell wall biosynthesis
LVATEVGEVPTVIQNGRTGMLVPAEEPDLLAAAIVELLRNAMLRERLGNAARQLVQDEFSAERMTADYLRVYEGAAATKAVRRNRRIGPSVTPQGKP